MLRGIFRRLRQVSERKEIRHAKRATTEQTLRNQQARVPDGILILPSIQRMAQGADQWSTRGRPRKQRRRDRGEDPEDREHSGGGSAGLSCTLSVSAGVRHGGRDNLPADATERNTMRQHSVLYASPPLLLPDVWENISASLIGQGKRYDEHTGKKENSGTNRGSFSFAWRWRD